MWLPSLPNLYDKSSLPATNNRRSTTHSHSALKSRCHHIVGSWIFQDSFKYCEHKRCHLCFRITMEAVEDGEYARIRSLDFFWPGARVVMANSWEIMKILVSFVIWNKVFWWKIYKIVLRELVNLSRINAPSKLRHSLPFLCLGRKILSYHWSWWSVNILSD